MASSATAEDAPAAVSTQARNSDEAAIASAVASSASESAAIGSSLGRILCTTPHSEKVVVTEQRVTVSISNRELPSSLNQSPLPLAEDSTALADDERWSSGSATAADSSLSIAIPNVELPDLKWLR